MREPAPVLLRDRPPLGVAPLLHELDVGRLHRGRRGIEEEEEPLRLDRVPEEHRRALRGLGLRLAEKRRRRRANREARVVRRGALQEGLGGRPGLRAHERLERGDPQARLLRRRLRRRERGVRSGQTVEQGDPGVRRTVLPVAVLGGGKTLFREVREGLRVGELPKRLHQRVAEEPRRVAPRTGALVTDAARERLRVAQFPVEHGDLAEAGDERLHELRCGILVVRLRQGDRELPLLPPVVRDPLVELQKPLKS